jgi:hypothetical protein
MWLAVNGHAVEISLDPRRRKRNLKSHFEAMVLLLLFVVLGGGTVLTGPLEVIARRNGPPVYFLGKQVLTFAPGALPAPHASDGVIHVDGERGNGTFLVHAWKRAGREKRSSSDPLLHTGTASVRVVLVNLGTESVSCSKQDVANVFTRPWGIRDYFGAMASVGGGVSNLQLESVTAVNLPGSYPPTADRSFSVCTQLVNDVFAALAESHSHTLLLLASSDTDCGIGASPIGCFPCYSVVWMLPDCGSLGLVLHELLHTMGLYHSNLKTSSGEVVPYGDGSCAMGLSLADPGLARRGVSVPQLLNLGVVKQAQVVDGSNGGTFVIATGYLNSTTAVKVVRVGSLFISFRHDDAVGLDNNVNVTVSGPAAVYLNPSGFPSFSEVVYVHEQDPSGPVNIVQVLQEDDSFALTEGLLLHFVSSNDTHASVIINSGSEVRAAVAPLTDKSMRRVVPLANAGHLGVTFDVAADDTVLLFDALSVGNAALYVGAAGGGYAGTITVNGVAFKLNRVLYDREQLIFPVSQGIITLTASPPLTLFSGNQCGYGGWEGDFQCGPRLLVLQSNPPDLNRDGHVNVLDLLIMVQQLGCVGCAGDFDRNGIVDASDMTWLLDYWTG